MSTLPICTVDAFVVDGPFQGNPAAVVVLPKEEELSDRAQLQIAVEMNLSETVYLQKQDGETPKFGIRWFTPAAEVDLCGHATLAAAHTLWTEGHVEKGMPITFSSKSGNLMATPTDNEQIELDFPNEGLMSAVKELLVVGADGQVTVRHEEDTLELLCRGLNLKMEQLLHVSRNRMDILVEIRADDFATLVPEMGALGKLRDNRVLSVTTRGGADNWFDFQSRSFAPAFGVPEDPVCGSAHCFLGPYWARKLDKDILKAKAASPRGGALLLTIAGDRVRLAGKATTTLRGTMVVPQT